MRFLEALLVPKDAKMLAPIHQYLIIWIVTVQHKGLLATILYDFNHEIWSGCQFRLGKQKSVSICHCWQGLVTQTNSGGLAVTIIRI